MVSGFEEPRSVAAIVGQSSQGLKIVVWKTSIFGQSSPLHRLYVCMYVCMYVCRYRGTWVCTHTINQYIYIQPGNY